MDTNLIVRLLIHDWDENNVERLKQCLCENESLEKIQSVYLFIVIFINSKYISVHRLCTERNLIVDQLKYGKRVYFDGREWSIIEIRIGLSLVALNEQCEHIR